jgi:hypothetical protein
LTGNRVGGITTTVGSASNRIGFACVPDEQWSISPKRSSRREVSTVKFTGSAGIFQRVGQANKGLRVRTVEQEVLSGSPPDRSRAGLPSGLLGMVALVVIVEAAILGLRSDIATPWADDWRLSAEAASTKATEAEILCFGDSLVKYGVLPNVIEARSGLKVYNLATSGGTMASSFFLFRQAIEAGAKPKAVVFDVAALMLLEDIPPKPLNFSELGSLRDCLDLGWTAGDGDFLGEILVGKLLPSYRWRFEVRERFLSALEGRSSSKRSDLASFRLLWSRENGAQPTPVDRYHHPEEDFLIDGVSPAKWACDPKERAYAERFLSLAESRKIPVYWLIPPMSPGVIERRALRGTDIRYDRFVRTITIRHRGAKILDARPSGYDDSTHVDHIHLNRRGASVLSSDLADLIRQDLDSKPNEEPASRPMPAFAGRSVAEAPPHLARSKDKRGGLR